MRYKGTLVDWNDGRGFGFIQPAEGGQRVFCHVKAFRGLPARPSVGMVVTYEHGADDRGRPRARDVRLAGVARSEPAGSRSSRSEAEAAPGRRALAYAGAAAFLAVIAVLVVVGRLPWFTLPWYVVLSVLTLLAYGWDKASAKGGYWRTKESRLNTLAFAGGWPGALIAQQGFRHKSRKASFQSAFWMAVALNVGVLALMAYGGPEAWDSVVPDGRERSFKQP